MEQETKKQDLFCKRGDTWRRSFIRHDANNEPILTTPEALYFTIKTSKKQDGFIIQKKLDDGITVDNTTGKVTVELKSEDTKIIPNTEVFVYDIEVIDQDYKMTLLEGKIKIDEDVTTYKNEG